MLVKRTSKNQLTLPKAVVEATGKVDYYDVTVEGRRIVLTPGKLQQANAVREKLESLGIRENDVRDAIVWSRK